ncbi:cysteine desulfurase NifS [mine drainage metagenome]|uniref:cysteine desulfurase n=1 Tax=mine drainage metagenome TaxID=410659 RepID=A0A1J5SE99_9ZZZZ
MFAPVYLDHNATTPLDPRVLEAMLPHLSGRCGNASSRHEYGRAARRAIDEARGRVAAALGAHATEVVFTSGGSEANNLFLKGAAACIKPGLLAHSALEHPSVREPARELSRRGWRSAEIAVDAEGRVDPESYAAILAEKPQLVSVMLANNETGVLQDVAALASRAKGAWFHSDAVQALGKIDVDFRALNAAGVHALSVSAHKINGPIGAGALVVDKRLELAPLVAGGGQERGLRSGTENVAAIVGFGLACEIAAARLTDDGARLAALRDELERGLARLGATVFGQGAKRLANTSYFALPEIDGETLVAKLDRAGFAVASGSACSSAAPEPSHVLRAMAVAPDLARGAVRVSLGHDNNEQQVANFLAALSATHTQLRRMCALAV